MSEIKVMIVDDSAIVRKHLSDLLTKAGIQVIGAASDPLFAMPRMRSNWPDVLVLDVEMPRMDGITFLKQVMAERPTPVVMCSTLTEKGGQTTMQALAAGAVGFVTKPKLGLKDFLEDDSNGIVNAVRAAAKANMSALRRAAPGVPKPGAARAAVPVSPQDAMAETTDRVIAIAISTGGVQTIEAVLTRLPRTVPGMVIVQHMPPNFTASLAARLNGLCELEVLEAKDGDRVINGRVLFAPGGRHMRLKRSGAQYVVEVFDGPLVNHHRPNADVLLKSVAQCAGRNAIGVVMTGMGDDGARGLKEMFNAGGKTAAQDEASCVVFGMPREAIKHGGAQQVVSLDDMPAWLMAAARSAVVSA
ncbi:MAG TPA: chemotaxis response regulator protein-glutamate methylesterase [Aquabacterium sp.]|uniref:protein-glutamate methylesterase/protein-glutamine glutaminase n=1 Tax=Aquabacterium sp. TaxID=1872578 RepID=UPI002E3541EC|nr:chemotaxis response regulator protein-glutamate methylesterase [Aquabacterium sp.]HEX5354667.1 chemotaxis response regulator protein-glutamate methylesterase [Aquabacterium sp.]